MNQDDPNNDDDNPVAPSLITDPVRIGSGQLARITDGVVQVVAPKPVGTYHFKMVAEHRHSGTLQVMSDQYDSLVTFLKQLEALDYLLISLERQPGDTPTLRA